MGIYFSGNNANEIYSHIYGEIIDESTTIVDSRNGLTKEKLHVSFSINEPRQRWISCRMPTISPALAFAELITIINGCDEADVINKWNPVLPKYQGNYKKYPGAYGTRLRSEFGFDQLNRSYEALLNNGDTRQVVLDIWKPDLDLPFERGIPNNEDIPCNICSLLKIRSKKLYWTQIMRSNDLFLGLPYNILQFTSLQEIMAGWLNIEVGEYMHFSDSVHFYCGYDMKLKKESKWANTDDLRLDKVNSDKVFEELFHRLKELGEAQNIDVLVNEIILQDNLPSAYTNILMILCLYMLYKKSSNDELKKKCYEKCTNNLYKHIFVNWLEDRRG